MKKRNHHGLKLIASLLLITSVSFHCHGQSKKNLLLALSKSDHTLAIVDPGSLKVLAKVPVGEDPHEVIASADGKTAYVSIYGGGIFHTINIIDLVAQKAKPEVDTKPLFGPHDLTYVNNKLWFTAEGSKAVGRLDPATNNIEWSMGTGQDRTHMLYVTNDANNIYTININSGTVSLLNNTPQNGRENWVQTLIPVARGSEGFDVTPDNKRAFVACTPDNYVSIIDLNTWQVTGKLDVGKNPDGLAWAEQ